MSFNERSDLDLYKYYITHLKLLNSRYLSNTQKKTDHKDLSFFD